MRRWPRSLGRCARAIRRRCSATPGRRRARLCETRRGLGAVTDMLILSCEERLLKPDTRIYQLAAERLGVAPEETLFVDDYLPNVEGARDAGMRAFHHTTREAALHELADLLR